MKQKLDEKVSQKIEDSGEDDVEGVEEEEEEPAGQEKKKKKKKGANKKSKKALKAANASIEILTKQLEQAYRDLSESSSKHRAVEPEISSLRAEIEVEKQRAADALRGKQEAEKEREEEDEEMCQRLMELEDELEEAKVIELRI